MGSKKTIDVSFPLLFSKILLVISNASGVRNARGQGVFAVSIVGF